MFSVSMQVRDYECDLQGVVNNAVYLNYLEHARHQFLQHLGVDFAQYTAQGVHLMLVRCELDFKASLRPNDRFDVEVALQRESRLKYAFVQRIVRHPDQSLVAQARAIGVALNPQGKPFVFMPFEADLTAEG
ncbi:MAG: acyl-CoA thioesterase [Thiotrichales bacterium]|nr:acyl-CoA thioesterase [Thiotrichales bacterium]